MLEVNSKHSDNFILTIFWT